MEAAAAHLRLEAAERGGERRRATIRIPRPRIPGGYALALLYVVLLSGLILLDPRLPSQAKRDMPWLLAMAVIPLLPRLAPFVRQFLAEVKVGPVSLSLRDLDREEFEPGVERIADVAAVAPVSASIGDLPSLFDQLVDRVRKAEHGLTEIVVIDLDGGCHLAALYLFAFLLEVRTRVRRLVFQTGSGHERALVGMCSPQDLRLAVERELPLFKSVRERTPMVKLDRAGQAFFDALGEQLDEGAAGVTAERLEKLLGHALERESIDRRELDGPRGLRRVLYSDRRYVAIVERGKQPFVVDQYRVSLEIARRTMDGPAAAAGA